MNVQFPRLLQWSDGNIIWRKNSSSKVVYLTFDDGPVPEVTPDVLDILDDCGVKATFFCVGENVEKYPEVYAEVLRRGHRTGNHTFNHLKGFEVAFDEYIENVDKAAGLIKSDLFRPPYGRIRPRQYRFLKKKYTIVMWDVITHDYNRALSAETIYNNVVRYSRKGSVIVFHDSVKAREHVLEILPRAIDYLKGEGYVFEML